MALSEHASRTRYTIKIKLKLRKWVLKKKSFQLSFERREWVSWQKWQRAEDCSTRARLQLRMPGRRWCVVWFVVRGTMSLWRGARSQSLECFRLIDQCSHVNVIFIQLKQIERRRLKVVDHWHQRLRECIRAKGQHFEQIQNCYFFLLTKNLSCGISNFFVRLGIDSMSKLENVFTAFHCHSPKALILGLCFKEWCRHRWGEKDLHYFVRRHILSESATYMTRHERFRFTLYYDKTLEISQNSTVS